MTIDEAIKQFEERLQIPDYKTQIPEHYEAMELAIKVFEEIQQYRELGAVEEIKYCIKQSEEEFNMLMEYRNIGTIEEFKELKEKSVAKKPPYDNHNQAGYDTDVLIAATQIHGDIITVNIADKNLIGVNKNGNS